jgi:histidinol-phosphate/aromatic aminotransferase/cobyric acid decarboxylase-like protein
MADRRGLERWTRRVHRWVRRDGAELATGLAGLPGVIPMPSAANFLLMRAQGTAPGDWRSLEPLRQALERRHRILVRDCRSFPDLGETWLRIGLRDRRGNRRLLRAMRREICREMPA